MNNNKNYSEQKLEQCTQYVDKTTGHIQDYYDSNIKKVHGAVKDMLGHKTSDDKRLKTAEIFQDNPDVTEAVACQYTVEGRDCDYQEHNDYIGTPSGIHGKIVDEFKDMNKKQITDAAEAKTREVDPSAPCLPKPLINDGSDGGLSTGAKTVLGVSGLAAVAGAAACCFKKCKGKKSGIAKEARRVFKYQNIKEDQSSEMARR